MAAGYGIAEMVRALLDRGADPRYEAGGQTALWAAAGGGAIADFTDAPPLGTCFPEVVEILRARAPEMKLEAGFALRAAVGLFGSEECRRLLRRLSE
jgi:hypothetical protein